MNTRIGIPRTKKEGRFSASRSDYYQRKHERETLVPELYIATLEGIKTPEQELLERERWQRLEHHIDQLHPRIGLALRMYYGIRSEAHTFRQIGELFGVTGGRVQQIVAKGERMLSYRLLKEESKKKWREKKDSDHAHRNRQQNRWREIYEPPRPATPDPAAEAAMLEQRWARQRERERHELAEREAERRRQRERHYDDVYEEACWINTKWDAEVRRRKRQAAFERQAQDLRDAYAAYHASRGTPIEQEMWRYYDSLQLNWGARLLEIWKEFP